MKKESMLLDAVVGGSRNDCIRRSRNSSDDSTLRITSVSDCSCSTLA